MVEHAHSTRDIDAGHETQRHNHDVLAKIWNLHTGGVVKACGVGKNNFNDEWDGTYKEDNTLLYSDVVWCGEQGKTPDCSSAKHGPNSPEGDADSNATGPCPRGYYCSKVVVGYDKNYGAFKRNFFYSKCRRYPDPGLCSVRLFKSTEDPSRDHDEMIRVCHKDYDPTRDDTNGNPLTTKCARKAFEFCIKEQKGHWVPGECKAILRRVFADKDALTTHKTDINRMLVAYLKKVRDIESSPPNPTQSLLRAKLRDLKSKSTPSSDFVLAYFYDSIVPTEEGKKSLIPIRAGKSCGEWAFISDQWCKNDFGEFSWQVGRNQHDCRWGQGKVECQTDTLVNILTKAGKLDATNTSVISDVSRKRGEMLLRFFSIARQSGGDTTKQHELMNEANIRRSFTGEGEQREFVTQVMDKIFAKPGSTEDSSYFPPFLPLSHENISRWVEQVMDPTAEWLFYPFDMQQTRSKPEADVLRDMHAILTFVDENIIDASNTQGDNTSSGAGALEEYLQERCDPLVSKPGKELMEDTACKTWLKLPVSVLKSNSRDRVIEAFCMVNNEAHAGSPECSCFWKENGNGAPWKDAFGKRNFDSEKNPSDQYDTQKRMFPPFCYLGLCQTNGLQTQKMVNDLSKSCPDCVQVNSVKGSNNRVNQQNSCKLKLDDVDGPSPTPLPSGPPSVKPSGPPSVKPSGPPSATSQSDNNGLLLSAGLTSVLCGCLMVIVVAFILFYVHRSF
jgi:hypothetical protein